MSKSLFTFEVESTVAGTVTVAIKSPVSAGVGAECLIFDRSDGSNLVTVAPESGTIDGETSADVTPGAFMRLVSDGAKWLNVSGAGGGGGGGSWLNATYLSGSWYAPGQIIPKSDTPSLAYAAPAANIRWAVPHVFGVAGTLTDIAAYTGGAGVPNTSKLRYAVYRSNATRTAPETRIFDSGDILGPGGFGDTKTEFNSLGLAVDAGELLWFCGTANAGDLNSLCVYPQTLYPILGTNFDGSGTTNPLRGFRVGYRVSAAYAAFPATWSGSTELLASNESGGVPICLFKFTPA